MTQTDKAALSDRLSNIGLVTPTLAEGQPGQMDAVRDIETITGEILEAKRVGGEAILTIGRGLIEAKAMLEHGEWLTWLSEKIEFSERQAQRLMKIAREYSNPTLVSDLGARKALQLLALSEAEREEFLTETHQVNGEEKAVIDMTSRELEKAIKERDEARRAVEQAQADTRAAQEARRTMEESLKEANSCLSLARMEKKDAASRADELEKLLAEMKAAPVDVAVMEVDQAALDKARAEGEAAKAEEIAALQAKLDKANESKKKADEKRRNAEATADILKLQLEEVAKNREKAAAMSDPDVAKFQVYFDQAQEVVNKLRGLLMRARGREEQTTAEKLTRAILALSDAIREAAK